MNKLLKRCFVPLLLVLAASASGTAMAQGTAAPAAAPAQEKLYNNEQLDQMMAPVALYPDSMLAQLFMACTYPSSVAEAAAWSDAHKDEKGEAAVKMVENENWDPAVKALVAFPQVLVQLKDQPDWVQKVGDAFLAQPKDVMDSVQRLRAQAQKAGNLESNEQQKVVVQQEPTTHQTVIEIQPTNPEVVYVPSYNPTQVYGTWAYPSYPPPYWPPPAYYYPMGGALAAGIMWGTGMAIAGNLWGNCNWGGGDININSNRNTNINTGNRNNVGNGNQKWSHNADNRRGTPYADKGNRERNGQADRGGANNRQDSRGRDSGGAGNRGDSRGGGAGSRDSARQASADSFNRASSQGAGNRQGGAGGDRGGAAGGGNRSASSAGGGSRGGGSAGGGSRSSGSNAFSGAGSGGSSQRSSSRGNSSMSSRSGGSSAGRSASRSAPSRGGGGGGGRRR